MHPHQNWVMGGMTHPMESIQNMNMGPIQNMPGIMRNQYGNNGNMAGHVTVPEPISGRDGNMSDMPVGMVSVNVGQVYDSEEKIQTGIGIVDSCLNGIWNHLVPDSVKERYPIIEWHSWFFFFCIDFVGDSWFTIVTLVMKRSEISAVTSSGLAWFMIISACLSMTLSLVVLCVRWFRLRPLMASMGWKLPQDEFIDDDDQTSHPAFRALWLEKRVGFATALGEDIPQTIMTLIVGVGLKEVTLDMVINCVTAVLAAARILWVALNMFLLSARERPLMDLFNATNGRHWHHRRGWGTARVALGKWHGVTTDRPGPAGRIVTLTLPHNNLTGELPTSFVESMDALGVVPGLWGNPELRGIPPRWQRKQRELERQAADKRSVAEALRAVRNDDVKQLQSYLASGGAVNGLTTCGHRRTTPLHLAAKKDRGSMVRLLLELGADVNAQEQDLREQQEDPGDDWVHKSTPLHEAARNGHDRVVVQLLEAGADVEAQRGDYKSTPLHEAARNNNTNVVVKLLQAGANVDSLNKVKRTPLHEAADTVRGSGQEVMNKLLEAGADINSRDSKLNSWDSKYNRMHREAFYHLQWKGGATPLHLAAANGNRSGIEVLLRAGADVNDVDNMKNTPLHYAASEAQIGVFETLVEAGADVNAKNDVTRGSHAHESGSRNGMTPFDVAATYGIKDEERKRGREAAHQLKSRYGAEAGYERDPWYLRQQAMYEERDERERVDLSQNL
jgi:ankyrin repeat protein